MEQIKVKKPSGAVIEVDDTQANRDYAELRDWVVIEKPVKKKSIKRSKKK